MGLRFNPFIGNFDFTGSGSSSSTASTTQINVTQTTHGFSVGDVVRLVSGSANTYTKAQADSAANAEVVGIVTVVLSANSFTLVTEGIVTTGVPAATAGTVMFLDPSTAGALTSTEPSTVGQVSKPLAIIQESGVRMLFSNMRGELLTGSGGGGGSALTVEEIDGSPSVANVSKIKVTNGTLTDDGSGVVTVTTGGGGGSGDVTGPVSSTDNAIPRWDGTGGDTLQDSGVIINDSNNISGIGTISSGAITSTGATALGSLTLTTDLAVTEGGTGASTAINARTNLLAQSKVFYTVGTDSKDDYVVDGTADQTEINSAITAANTAGGGIVHLKGAITYSISASIVMKSNVILEGEGWSTIIKVANGTNSASMHVIQGDTVDNGRIRDLQIDGNKTNQTTGGHAIRWDIGCTSISMDNLYIHDMCLHGIIFKETTLTYHNKVTINDIRVENCGVTADGSGIYLGNVNDIHMTNIFSSGHQLDGVQWKTSSYIELDNVTVSSNSRYGIYSVGNHANINNLTSYSNSTGVNVEYDGTNLIDTSINLSNANIYNNQADGIRISDSSGSQLTNVKSWNNGQGGSTAAGLKLTAASTFSVTHVQVNNSSFFDNQGSPTQDFGIWGSGAGTVNLNKISDTDCYGNSTTQFRTDTWSITNQVQNVQGFNPMIIVNHGTLGATKTFDRVNGHYQMFTMGADMTMTLTSGKQRGDVMTFQITQDGTGSRLMTWPSNFKKAGGTLTLSTAASAVDIVSMAWDGTNWREVSRSISTS